MAAGASGSLARRSLTDTAERSSRRRLHAAEAGGLDRHVGPGRGDVETLLDDAGFRVLAEPHQAFVKSVQAPDVFRMLAGARQRAVKAEIGAVDRLRFLHMALFQQKRSEEHTSEL